MQFQNDEELYQFISEHKFDNSIIYKNPTYCTAIVGFSLDGRAIYNLFSMIRYLADKENMTTDEALTHLDKLIKIDDDEKEPIIILEEFE